MLLLPSRHLHQHSRLLHLRLQRRLREQAWKREPPGHTVPGDQCLRKQVRSVATRSSQLVRIDVVSNAAPLVALFLLYDLHFFIRMSGSSNCERP